MGQLVVRLQAMCEAFGQGDFEALADHAHWLKGTGGTVGFAEFTEPARRLESLAKSQATEEIPALLQDLVQLAEAVRLDECDSTTAQDLVCRARQPDPPLRMERSACRDRTARCRARWDLFSRKGPPRGLGQRIIVGR